MRHSLFDDTDLTALTRALIPWTSAVIIPEGPQMKADLMQRTRAGYALPEWRQRDLNADIQVARAARSIYVSEALSRGMAVVIAWLRRSSRRRSEQQVLATVRV